MPTPWLQILTLAGAAIASEPQAVQAADPATAAVAGHPSRFDRYGGLRALPARASGWFRLGRFGARHLFVTPDGHGYFALGVNHLAAVGAGGAPGTG